MTVPFSVYHGAHGWQHPAWAEAFYPDDMPEEWRLAFYNTQFRCVFLDRALWQAATPEVWAARAEETQEGFRFVLEASGDASCDAAMARALGGRAVFVESAEAAGLLWFDAASDLRALADRIKGHVASDAPIYLISRDADIKRLEQVDTLIKFLGL